MKLESKQGKTKKFSKNNWALLEALDQPLLSRLQISPIDGASVAWTRDFRPAVYRHIR